ncbi:hypothetical protein RJT34_14511 [Clitoria ternatea]|uniref:Wall-associated receptor kinase galacturonan-binding domain-containing protein n=1 Tax=Clitoria ternatea TaxID=43366 RepID=A0AAN9JT96_CLITE
MIIEFVQTIIILMIWSIYPLTYAQYDQNLSIAQPGCNSVCGNVSIPYPFGMNDPKCYGDKWFEIACKGGQKPYLKYINLEVKFIDIRGGVQIMNPIYRRNCQREDALPNIQLGGGPFAYDDEYNTFVAVGRNIHAVLESYLNVSHSQTTECVAVCDDDNKTRQVRDIASCGTERCCQVALPPNLLEFKVTTEGLPNVTHGCSYALLIIPETYRFLFDEFRYNVDWVPSVGDLNHLDAVPAMLNWEIPINSTLKVPADDANAYCYDTNITSSQYARSGQRCHCYFGGGGNPYVPGGCAGK